MSAIHHIRFSRRTAVGMLLAVAASPTLSVSVGAAQEATPVFSPVVPAGPLGEQITWLVGVFGSTEKLTEEIVNERFASSFLASSPAADLVTVLQNHATTLTTAHIVPGTLITGQEDGVSVAGFEVAGVDNQLLLVNIEVSGSTGLIGMLILYPGEARLATPVAGFAFPEGPLGGHARWFLDVLNAGPGAITAAQLAEHFTPEHLSEDPAAQMLLQIAGLVELNEVWRLDPASVVSTKDLPATVTRFQVIGSSGDRILVAMTLDRYSGLLSSLELELAVSSEATPAG